MANCTLRMLGWTFFVLKTDGRNCCPGIGGFPVPSVGCVHKLVWFGVPLTLWLIFVATPHSYLLQWSLLGIAACYLYLGVDLAPLLLDLLSSYPSSPAGEISSCCFCPPPGLLAWLRIWRWWCRGWICLAAKLLSSLRRWTGLLWRLLLRLVPHHLLRW